MRKLVVLIIALTTITGCTVGPDYVRPEVDTPEDWRFKIEDAAGTVNTEWWEQFNDPVLDALINQALLNNKDSIRRSATTVRPAAAAPHGMPQAIFLGPRASMTATWPH